MQAHATNLGVQLFQAPRRSNERPARAQPCDEMGDPAGNLLPDLVRGGAVVGLPIRGIAVLIRVKVLVRLGGNDFMDSANRAVGALVARSDDQLRAIGRQDTLAFVRSAIGQAKLHGIAHGRANHSVSDAGVAAGGVNDGFAALQCAAREPRLNHVERWPVFDGAAGVEPLGLSVELNMTEFPAQAFEPQKGSIPDTAEQAFTATTRLSR